MHVWRNVHEFYWWINSHLDLKRHTKLVQYSVKKALLILKIDGVYCCLWGMNRVSLLLSVSKTNCTYVRENVEC